MREKLFSMVVRVLGLVVLVGLVATGQANATHLDPSDAFYWSLPALRGYPSYEGGAIATSRDGNLVYVADTYANAVEEYSSDGALIHVLRFRAPTEPSGVTTDLSGNVYVVYEATGTVAKFTANLKLLSTWSVPFAKSIAADRAGHLWVLTNFLDAVGEYDSSGKSIGGFAATNWPGSYFDFDGYDAPYKWVATAIAVDRTGYPIVVGESYQSLSNPEPDCHSVIDSPYPYGVDHHPYPDPLVSGEAVRFTSSGTAVGYGWLSESSLDCYHGWQSDGLNPGGVAVDPNAGDIYATSDSELGVIHLGAGLGNTDSNLNAPSYACYSLNCPARDWDLIAGNTPSSVASDCRSNLYMLSDNGNARYVTKFINLDYVPPSSCSTLLQRASLASGITVLSTLQVHGAGKASVVVGCHVKLCVGKVDLSTAAGAVSLPLHFRIPPGVQKTLSLRLTRRGRLLLARRPGVRIEIVAKLKGGKTSVESEQLRKPVALGVRCTFPGTVGGGASVSGTLSPVNGRHKLTIEYVPPEISGALLPAVQRTVLTDAAGRFVDHYALDSAGKWTVLVSWAGDSTQEPAGAPPCAATVQRAQPQVTITCPQSASIGTPGTFSGGLSGAPADAAMAVLYEDPSGAILAHNVTTDSLGKFSDSLAPSRTGGWQAIAHYNGDANYAPAQAACQFTVPAPAPSSLSLHCTPDSNRKYINCTGQVTSGGAGIPAAQVSLTYQPPPGSGSATTDNVITAADGSFSDQLNAPVGGLLATGSWQVQAQYGGDSTHAPASNTQTVTVS